MQINLNSSNQDISQQRMEFSEVMTSKMPLMPWVYPIIGIHWLWNIQINLNNIFTSKIIWWKVDFSEVVRSILFFMMRILIFPCMFVCARCKGKGIAGKASIPDGNVCQECPTFLENVYILQGLEIIPSAMGLTWLLQSALTFSTKFQSKKSIPTEISLMLAKS